MVSLQCRNLTYRDKSSNWWVGVNQYRVSSCYSKHAFVSCDKRCVNICCATKSDNLRRCPRTSCPHSNHSAIMAQTQNGNGNKVSYLSYVSKDNMSMKVPFRPGWSSHPGVGRRVLRHGSLRPRQLPAAGQGARRPPHRRGAHRRGDNHAQGASGVLRGGAVSHGARH